MLITGLCNSRCVFCFSRKELPRAHFDPDMIKDLVRKEFVSGSRILVLSGGEPTTHPNFHDIIAYAWDMGYEQIRAITNGRMFNYLSFAKKARESGLHQVIFSLHSHLKNIQDDITCVEGSFDEEIGGISNCIRLGMDVKVNVVVTRRNLDGLSDMLRFLSGLGVKHVELLRLMPFGRAWGEGEEIYTVEDIPKEMLVDLIDEAHARGISLSFNRFEIELFEGMEDSRQNPYKFINEVYSRLGDFQAFAKEGKMMYCYPDRCEFCFLKDFCSALIEECKNPKLSGCIVEGKVDPVRFAKEYIKRYDAQRKAKDNKQTG